MAERAHEPIALVLPKLLGERGMSSAALCRASGVSPGAVSRYLSGDRGTRLDGRGAQAMEKLAAALGVAPTYFVEYRTWQIREIAVAYPQLVDDLYDLILEAARLRGVRQKGTDDAKQ